MSKWIADDKEFRDYMNDNTSARVEDCGLRPNAINLDAYNSIVAIRVNQTGDQTGKYSDFTAYGITGGTMWQEVSGKLEHFSESELIEAGYHPLFEFCVFSDKDSTTSIWDVAKEVVACLCRYAEVKNGNTE